MHNAHVGAQVKKICAVCKSKTEALGLSCPQREWSGCKQESDVEIEGERGIEPCSRIGIGKLFIQSFGPVKIVGEKDDVVRRQSLKRANPVHLESRQPDLIGFMQICFIEVRFAACWHSVSLACIMRIRHSIGTHIVHFLHPIHVFISNPPPACFVGGPIFKRSVECFEFCKVVMGLHILANRFLANNKLTRPAGAGFISDAVIVIVNPVFGFARCLEICITNITCRTAVSCEVTAVPSFIPCIDKVQASSAVVERVIVIRFGNTITRDSRASNARVHIETEDDVLDVVRRSFV